MLAFGHRVLEIDKVSVEEGVGDQVGVSDFSWGTGGAFSGNVRVCQQIVFELES
jgi:hypothetical protein